jgi:hypothetical protein
MIAVTVDGPLGKDHVGALRLQNLPEGVEVVGKPREKIGNTVAGTCEKMPGHGLTPIHADEKKGFIRADRC